MSGLSSKDEPPRLLGQPPQGIARRARGELAALPSGQPLMIREVMYDVIYIDSQGAETPVAQHMSDRSDAAKIAKVAAAERNAGRMVLPGSAKLTNCVCVVPVLTEAA
jgi:hypothetical protein